MLIIVKLKGNNIMSNQENDSGKVKSGNITASTFVCPPPPVGYWVIGGGFSIAVLKKPTEQQIANTIEHFGWEWRQL